MSVARIYKAGTPYNAVDLGEIDYVQSFDVMYLAHLDYDFTKMIRLDHTDWTFSSVTFGPTLAAPTALAVTVTNPNQDAEADPPGNAYFPQKRTYIVTAVNDATGQESRPSGSDDGTNDLSLKRNKNTLAWTGSADRYRVYASDNEQAYGWIGDSETEAFTDDNLAPDLTDGPPEGFNPFADDGSPSTVTFFEQRLFAARTRARPNAIYASRSADFENMDRSRPLKEDDGIAMAIVAQKVNAVNALVPIEKLMALTGDGPFKLVGANGDFISANPPPRALRQSGRGSNRLKPLVIDEAVFFRPSIGSEVRTLGFSFEIDGYQSNDVSIYSPRLFRGFDIVDWTYSEEPMSVVWTARSDGKMPTFTWQKEQQVWGWTLCQTDGVVESLCTIPENGEDRTYLVVKRTINGVERRFLERMASAKWEDVKDSCYLDCAKSFLFAEPTQTVTGLWHLEGATVDAIANGFTVRGLVVEGGSVDLGFECPAGSKASVGLPFEALVETLPLVFQVQGLGSTKARKQTQGDVVVQVVDTRGIEVGPRLDRMFPPKPRGNEPLGTPNSLITGALGASQAPVVSGETTLFIRSTEPLPMTITSVFIEPKISETG